MTGVQFKGKDPFDSLTYDTPAPYTPDTTDTTSANTSSSSSSDEEDMTPSDNGGKGVAVWIPVVFTLLALIIGLAAGAGGLFLLLRFRKENYRARASRGSANP